MVCSRLGTTLCLNIQKGEELMNKDGFQNHIVGTVSCMKRLMMDTKCGSN